MAGQKLSPAEGAMVHESTQAFVESTNVWTFMQEYGIDDYDELIERTTTDINGD